MGKPLPRFSVLPTDDIKKRYHQRTPKQILQMVHLYKASYLVSRTKYRFPVLYSTATYKVYDLRQQKPKAVK